MVTVVLAHLFSHLHFAVTTRFRSGSLPGRLVQTKWGSRICFGLEQRSACSRVQSGDCWRVLGLLLQAQGLPCVLQHVYMSCGKPLGGYLGWVSRPEKQTSF